MFGKTSLIFLIVFFSNFLENFALKRQVPASACELISSKPVSYPTPSPTSINTEEAKLIDTVLPLINVNELFPFTKIVNTGYALSLKGNPPPIGTRVFGGVLCNQTYVFHIAEFYQTSNVTGRSYGLLNGKGAPLTVTQTYYNKKYGTFENALKYRNGLVIEVLSIDFSPEDNPLFYPIQFLINIFLREPGSFFYVPAGFAFAWYGMQLPILLEYLAQYGAYIDLETGEQHESAIILLPVRPSFALSKFQFENSFLNLLNHEGKKMDNAPPLKPFKRPLYKGVGFLNLWRP